MIWEGLNPPISIFYYLNIYYINNMSMAILNGNIELAMWNLIKAMKIKRRNANDYW